MVEGKSMGVARSLYVTDHDKESEETEESDGRHGNYERKRYMN